MSDLKKHLTNGTIAMPQPKPVEPEPVIDMGKLAIARYGQEVIVTHLTVEYIARQFAGTFFELNRSKRFRSIWGTSDKKQNYYIDKNWAYFIQPAKECMTKMLTDPLVPQDQKDAVYLALCQENAVTQLVTRESGSLQMEKDSEHFDGDKSLSRDVDNLENA